MSEFEDDLTRAMQRIKAPEGFADRVVKRAEAAATPPTARLFVMPKRQVWWSGAIAAALILGVFVPEQIHVRHEREQAAQAQQQFDAAMRITDHALDHTRARLERAGLKLGN